MAEQPFALDKAQMRLSFERAARRYDEAAVLQREVGARLIERLDLVRLQPARVLDLGAGTGVCTRALAKRYRKAQVLALDIAAAMLGEARRRRGWFSRQAFVCGDAESLPLADDSVDLIVSNLTVQWCQDLDRAFAECFRVLRPGGLLLFSTLGPDTLHELRASWQVADRRSHVNAFIDMHDVGDALLRARLADPVMDVEHITLTYPDVQRLMRDLKTLGAHNVTAGRAHGLTGKGRLRAMIAAYEGFRRDGVLPASYEVVYGHAWAPAVKTRQTVPEEASFSFPLSRLRDSLRDAER